MTAIIRPCRAQADADALMAEAAADYPPLPGMAQRHCLVRLVQGAYLACGTMNLPRGWVRAAQQEMARAGLPVPTAKVVRWVRAQCRACPPWLELVPDIDPDFLSDMADLTD